MPRRVVSTRSLRKPCSSCPGVEQLERRVVLAVAQISFVDFDSIAGLIMNGFNASPTARSSSRLRLTDGGDHQARSVWHAAAVPVQTFRSDFSFRSNASSNSADGLTFTLHNGATTSLGVDGDSLGYAGIGASEAVAFNMFNKASFGSRFGFASDGEKPPTTVDMSPLDLHGGQVFHATVKYDGTTLTADLTDASDRSKRFSDSKVIDLPAALGTDMAIVGFTASTGDHVSTQEILSWSFSGSNAPTVEVAATASPNPVNDRNTTLSVLGADSAGDEGALTYTWSVNRKPSGARDPTLSENGSNAAQSTSARFFKDGHYRFRCTITNASGGSTSSDVLVEVRQTASAVRMTPHAQVIPLRSTMTYRALILDQFNRPLRVQPAITFSVLEGSGDIDSASGRFTASPGTVGHVVIAATVDDLTGTSGATVIA